MFRQPVWIMMRTVLMIPIPLLSAINLSDETLQKVKAKIDLPVHIFFQTP